MEKELLNRFARELAVLQEKGNLRTLPSVTCCGREIKTGGNSMLNLSSNDYLGIAADKKLRNEFLGKLTEDNFVLSSSSSRLLTGNFTVCSELEGMLADLFGTESALVFGSGYHMNIGILPAVSDSHTLILADKLVHASLIDGIRLSSARFMRYLHLDYLHLQLLLEKYCHNYQTVIIVTESIFSMDGDEADLAKLVSLKKRYPNVLLYVDEAHAIGVRGLHGLGCAEEQDCILDIDFLAGTFGKALASVGGYVVCRKIIRDYLVNKMRTLIFTTALPPVNLMWTAFVLQRLDSFTIRRETLRNISDSLRAALVECGYPCSSASHIVPMVTGNSHTAVLKAREFQQNGFFVLPVRPPTVPEGTSRIRFSLTAALTDNDMKRLTSLLLVQEKRKI